MHCALSFSVFSTPVTAVRCQIHQHFMYILYKSALHIFSLITVWLCNIFAKEYQHQSCSHNVDEIDYRCQFHQYFFTKLFCAAILWLQFGFVIFSTRILKQKLLVKCWWNWLQVIFPCWRRQHRCFSNETKLKAFFRQVWRCQDFHFVRCDWKE